MKQSSSILNSNSTVLHRYLSSRMLQRVYTLVSSAVLSIQLMQNPIELAETLKITLGQIDSRMSVAQHIFSHHLCSRMMLTMFLVKYQGNAIPRGFPQGRQCEALVTGIFSNCIEAKVMLLRSSLKNQGQTYQTCVFCTDSDRQFYKLWREGTHLIVLVKRYSCRKYGAVGYFHDLLHHEPAGLLNSRCFHCLSFKRDRRMAHKGDLVVIGISVGLALGILIASLIFFGIWWYKKRSNLQQCSNESTLPTVPIRMNDLGTSNDFSASLASSVTIRGSEHSQKSSPVSSWWNHHSKDQFASASGILRYSYKDIQKATQKFTTVLGQGSFGPVYKAVMSTGEVLAVKVLASNSKQGGKEFQTEVLHCNTCT
ncbi:calcium/calmodulin-regulated receptor-like kinase 2 isoform X4 [Populus alba x Populus x berolinensis]|nr:calcium/calmodulin-regulated receptor-like kinase 2 isoform X4 [Populus alba x Populus x berolinensis]